MITMEKLTGFGANAAEGLSRCMNNEKLYFRLIEMSLNQPYVANLGEALASKDYSKAFEAAHGLKGVMGNLSLTPVYGPVSELTELLRNGKEGDYMGLYEEISRKLGELKALFD